MAAAFGLSSLFCSAEPFFWKCRYWQQSIWLKKNQLPKIAIKGLKSGRDGRSKDIDQLIAAVEANAENPGSRFLSFLEFNEKTGSQELVIVEPIALAESRKTLLENNREQLTRDKSKRENWEGDYLSNRPRVIYRMRRFDPVTGFEIARSPQDSPQTEVVADLLSRLMFRSEKSQYRFLDRNENSAELDRLAELQTNHQVKLDKRVTQYRQDNHYDGLGNLSSHYSSFSGLVSHVDKSKMLGTADAMRDNVVFVFRYRADDGQIKYVRASQRFLEVGPRDKLYTDKIVVSENVPLLHAGEQNYRSRDVVTITPENLISVYSSSGQNVQHKWTYAWIESRRGVDRSVARTTLFRPGDYGMVEESAENWSQLVDFQTIGSANTD